MCNLSLGVVCLLVTQAGQGDRAAAREARTTPVVRAFQEASPAVVNLSTTSFVSVRDPIAFGGIFDDIFDFPIPRTRQIEQHSVGSGFLIHDSGYLVTNAHVIDRAVEIKVTFADGAGLPAREVATDRRNDLAVLKVESQRPLPHIKLGRSDDLMPGETVIAIGNPLGFSHTVTTGIISALDRELRVQDQLAYSGLIQIDAPINPGNSGGPLLNVLGELVGINSAIRGDAQNIGFAIPVDRLHELLPEMLDIHRLRGVQFGIHFSRSAPGQNGSGVQIGSVEPGSSATKAGIRVGDTLTAINGRPTREFMDVFSLLDQIPLGSNLRLEFLRDGVSKTCEMVFSRLPPQDSARMLHTFFGIVARNMKAPDLRRLSVKRPVGLVVTEIRAGSSAHRQRLEPGDLIVKFGGVPVASLESLGPLIVQVDKGDQIPFEILRVGRERMVRAQVGLLAE